MKASSPQNCGLVIVSGRRAMMTADRIAATHK
jgi:hypothetical protein